MIYNKIKQACISSALIAIFALFLGACAPNQTDSALFVTEESDNKTRPPKIDIISKTVSLPHYLGKVWPEPNSTVSRESYHASLRIGPIDIGNTGIGVVFLADEVAQNGDVDIKWPGRCSFLVDNEEVSDDVWLIEDGLVLIENKDEQGNLLFRVSGPYYIAWLVPLEQGTHKATFQVRRTTGEVLEYSWSFTIIP